MKVGTWVRSAYETDIRNPGRAINPHWIPADGEMKRLPVGLGASGLELRSVRKRQLQCRDVIPSIVVADIWRFEVSWNQSRSGWLVAPREPRHPMQWREKCAASTLPMWQPRRCVSRSAQGKAAISLARGAIEEIRAYSWSVWAPSPSMPRPSRVGTPKMAVKLPSEPPPVRGHSCTSRADLVADLLREREDLRDLLRALERRAVHAAGDSDL